MKPRFSRYHSNAQRGAVSIGIIMLLMFILAAAVTGALNISGSSVMDAKTNEEQIAALFLAESGLERAQGILRTAALAGTITDSTCTALRNQTANLGRGTFTYLDARSTPATCGGLNPACTQCDLTVKGTIGTSSRSIQGQMSASRSDGVEGYGHQFSLSLKTLQNNSFAFTHLAYNPQTNWGGDAVSGYCVNNGAGSLTSCTESWKIAGTYYNNPASQGVFASVATMGIYTITEELKTTSNPSTYTDRNYVEVGVTFGPLSSTVTHVGSYANSTNNVCIASTAPRTQPVTYYVGNGTNTQCATWEYQHGYLPSNWTCNPSNGTTANWSNAGTSDTLMVGFGGKPYYSGSGARATNQLTGLSLNGQPLFRQVTMVGTQGDNMYSQIWFAYNAGYYATAANATNLASVATITASMGASFSGHTTNSGARLVLDSTISASEMLSTGDLIKNSAGTTSYGTLGSLRSGTAGQTGAIYNVSNGTGSNVTTTAMKSFSTVLLLNSAPSSGTMALNDTITNAAGTTTYGTLSTKLSGTLNAAGSTYQLTGGTAQQISSAANNMRATRESTTITLTGATTLPTVGTALAVVPGTGTGQFLPDSFTGNISGTTLNVTAATGTNLSVGDALFGASLKANTRITARVSGTGGTGSYTITPSQTVASSTMTARAAVVSVASANSFTISRLPDTKISNAQLCGGLCPFLMSDGSHTVGEFALTGVNNYDDWSSGFACLSGVDPASIESLGTVLTRRIGWTELIQ